MNILMTLKNYFGSERNYTVRKGNQSPDGKAPLMLNLRKKRDFFVETNQTWAYDHRNDEDQRALNKIIGLRDGARVWAVGYSYSISDSMIDLYFCQYEDEIEISYFVKNIEIGEFFILKISERGYIFLDGIYVGKINSNANYGFLLEPHFGDKIAAPHDWKILSIIF
jgi:hypothetical protein